VDHREVLREALREALREVLQEAFSSGPWTNLPPIAYLLPLRQGATLSNDWVGYLHTGHIPIPGRECKIDISSQSMCHIRDIASSELESEVK
jgi:hypothetical protein